MTRGSRFPEIVESRKSEQRLRSAHRPDSNAGLRSRRRPRQRPHYFPPPWAGRGGAGSRISASGLRRDRRGAIGMMTRARAPCALGSMPAPTSARLASRSPAIRRRPLRASLCADSNSPLPNTHAAPRRTLSCAPAESRSRGQKEHAARAARRTARQRRKDVRPVPARVTRRRRAGYLHPALHLTAPSNSGVLLLAQLQICFTARAERAGRR